MLCVPAFAPARDFGGPVDVVSLLAAGHEVWSADFGPGRTRIPAGTRTVDGVSVRYFRRLGAYRWSPIVPQVYFEARRATVDLAHIFGLRDGLTVPASAGFKAAGIPYVVEPMGMLVPRVRSLGLKRAFDSAIGERLLRGAAGLIATSEQERGEIGQAVPGSRVWLRRNPIATPASTDPDDTLRDRLGIAAGAFLVAYVGRVSTKKGLDLLAHATAITRDVHALIVGPDSGDGGEAQLTQAVAKHGVSDRIHRLAPVWGHQRDRLVAACDAFVLPSRTENFGNAAAEASAVGIPVIVTAECGVAELVAEFDAGIVTGVDVEDLAAALRHLRDDPPLRARMGANGRRLAAELAPDKIGAQQEAIYREILG